MFIVVGDSVVILCKKCYSKNDCSVKKQKTKTKNKQKTQTSKQKQTKDKKKQTNKNTTDSINLISRLKSD